MQKDTLGPIRILLRHGVLTAAALAVVAIFRTVWRANDTTVALAFLMLVMVTASRWRLRYSVYLSVLCTLLYNFFFFPPIGRFTIQDPRNWVALSAFLACSVLVSHLSNQEHLHAEAAEQRRREVERLYEFSQQLLLQDDPRQLARAAPAAAAAAFGFRSVALYVREDDAVYSSDPDNEAPSVIDLRTAATAESAGALRDGFRMIPLALGMRSSGVLAVTEAGYSSQVYEAIGSLVAIALERAAALERSSRLEASRASERLRSALLDSVTHDLRTPLTSIRAAATTLVSSPDLAESEREELTAVIDEESARLDRLIGQAVDMAQFDAAAVTLHRQAQDIQELLDTTVEEMQGPLRGRGVAVDVESCMPAISMDRELIHRALRHLIENAIRYSPPGSPISLAARRDDDRLLIEVIDHGPGIDPAEQPFVFDKFFRGRQHRTSAKGTGMGLAIAKAILEAHTGGVSVSSSPGKGAVFTLWLPLPSS